MANPADTKFDQGAEPIILIEADYFTIASSNDALRIVEDPAGTPDNIDIDIADGIYSGDELAYQIHTALTAESASSGNTQVYDSWYDQHAHFFTIRNTTAGFEIKIDVSEGDMSTTIGFSGDQTSSGTIKQLVSDVMAAPGSNSLYYATKAITAGTGNDFDSNGPNRNYSAEIALDGGLGVISKSVDEMGGFGSVANTQIGLLNQELESDFFATYPNIQNDAVNIYCIFNDGTDLAYAERTLLMAGSFNSPFFDSNRLILPIEDNKKRLGRIIPKTKIDVGAYPDADKNSIGRPIQLLFGDFNQSFGVNDHYQPYFPALPACGLIEKPNNKFLFAENILNSFGTGSVYIWREPYGWVHFSATSVSLAADPPTIEFSGYLYGGVRVYPAEFHEDDPADITDFTNMVDNDTGTSVDLANNEAIYVKPPAGSLGSLAKMAVNTELGLVITAGTVAGDPQAQVIVTTGGAKTDLGAITTGINTFDLNGLGLTLPGTWEELMQWGWGVACDGDDTVEIQEFHFWCESVVLSLDKLPSAALAKSAQTRVISNFPEGGFIEADF